MIKLVLCSQQGRIKQLLAMKTEALEKLGSSAEMDEDEKRVEMLKIIDKFARTYKGQIDSQTRTEIDTQELTAGARIDFIFEETLRADLESLNPLDPNHISDTEIIKAIRNSRATGMRLSNAEVIIIVFHIHKLYVRLD